MKTQQSLPKDQPQPTESMYSIDALNRLPKFTTAAAYEAFFGVAPPSYDPTMDFKFWEDDSQKNQPEGEEAVYEVLATAVSPTTGVASYVLPLKFVQLLVPSAKACRVNIWQGLPTYPVYTPAPTDAVETITLSDGSLEELNVINAEYLSTSDQAHRLYITLQGQDGLFIDAPATGPGNIEIDYKSESRRMYAFKDSNGQKQIVGILVDNENAKGMGYPGVWANVPNPEYVAGNQFNTPQNVWVWIKGTPPNITFPTKVVITPMPVRKLYNNEKFVEEAIGQPMISRTL